MPREDLEESEERRIETSKNSTSKNSDKPEKTDITKEKDKDICQIS